MKYLIILLLSSFSYAQDLTIGYVQGVHLANTDLYNKHLFVDYKESVMIYENSYEKTSVAVYHKFGVSSNFSVRVGLTTGYNKVMEYNGQKYKVDSVITDNLGLFLAPTYEYNIKDNVYFNAVLIGDSINLGFSIKF